MNTQPQAVTKPEVSAPPAAMIDAMVMQLESITDMVKLPDYVETDLKAFIASLRRWSGGGK